MRGSRLAVFTAWRKRPALLRVSAATQPCRFLALSFFSFSSFWRLPPTTMKVIPPPRAQQYVWLRCHAPLSLLPSRLVRSRGFSVTSRRSPIRCPPLSLLLHSKCCPTLRVTAALLLTADDHARIALLYHTTLCPHSTGLAMNYSLPRIKMHEQPPLL